MGVHLKVELGFYFELDESVKEKSHITKYRCSNTLCAEHYNELTYKHSDFCGKCGNANEEINVPSGDKFPSLYDFCEEHFNAHDIVTLSNNEYGTDGSQWLYNRQSETLDYLIGDFNVADGGTLNLSTFNAAQLLTDFKKETDVIAFIKAFEAVYGIGTIQARIGLLSEYN